MNLVSFEHFSSSVSFDGSKFNPNAVKSIVESPSYLYAKQSDEHVEMWAPSIVPLCITFSIQFHRCDKFFANRMERQVHLDCSSQNGLIAMALSHHHRDHQSKSSFRLSRDSLGNVMNCMNQFHYSRTVKMSWNYNKVAVYVDHSNSFQPMCAVPHTNRTDCMPF